MDIKTSDPIYREHLMDHYKNPRNFGKIEDSIHSRGENPSCGDEMDIYLEIEGNKIKDFKFTSKGCAISTASASVLSEKLKEKRVDEVLNMTRDDMKDLLGIDVSVSRVKCMMLGLKTLQTAIKGELNEQ